ncbi:MAG: hypothetical protein JW909_06210, partial [Planctomycetes bacterium]|nr:hypothetical protein [Planctomycetota bacterium]
VITMRSPFVVAHADVEARGDGPVTMSVQSRLGKADNIGPGALPDNVVRGVYEYQLAVKCRRLDSLKVHSLVQHNRSCRPFLVPGRNTWDVKADGPLRSGKLHLEVAYRLRRHTKGLKERFKSGENLYDNRHVKEDDKSTVVRKEIKAAGTKMMFDIPEDGTDDPAYPRMEYISYIAE